MAHLFREWFVEDDSTAAESWVYPELERHHFGGVADEFGEVGWGYPRPTDRSGIRFGRPTGDCAGLSDVNRNRVFLHLGEQFSQGREAKPFDLRSILTNYQISCITRQNEPDLLAFDDGTVHT
jgi:hypothetical protein